MILLRYLFLFVGLTCLGVSWDFSNMQIVGAVLVSMALMPDD